MGWVNCCPVKDVVREWEEEAVVGVNFVVTEVVIVLLGVDGVPPILDPNPAVILSLRRL